MARKETIGNRLTIARMEKGKGLKPPRVPDLKEIAEDLGVSAALVGQWEADDIKDWKLGRLRQLAAYYGIRLAWLIDGESPMRPTAATPAVSTEIETVVPETAPPALGLPSSPRPDGPRKGPPPIQPRASPRRRPDPPHRGS